MKIILEMEINKEEFDRSELSDCDFWQVLKGKLEDVGKSNQLAWAEFGVGASHKVTIEL